MALLTFEGFEYLASSNPGTDLSLAPDYIGSNGGLKSSTTPYGVGSSFQCNAGGQGIVYNYPSALSTVIVGFKFRGGSWTTLLDFVRFFDGASIQCGIGVNTSGKLIFYRGTSATVIATGTATLAINSWYRIEAKITFGNSASYEIRLDGVAEISGTGDTTNTANNSSSRISVGYFGGSANPIFDDFYVCDTTGSVNNDFLGNVRVETSFVSSNDSVQFTPLSSTNASQVDEVASDGDTTYNSSSTVGHVDTFNHDALLSTPNQVFGVMVIGKGRKDDATARTARNKLKSGATTSNGASYSMATTYAYLRDVYELDPDTSVAWTQSGVDATKIGYEYVS